jgi:two-component system cell cycle sensor histidine kinase/response regulator CckA
LSARDGPEALAIFAQQMHSIRLVLTDMSMPYMNGVTLTRALKKMKSNLPIIACTGQGEEPCRAELKELGVADFLTKPFDSSNLLETLHGALEETAASPAL